VVGFLGLRQDCAAGDPATVNDSDPAAIVRRCKELSSQDRDQYIRDLGTRKNFRALEAIYKAGFFRCEFAATHAALAMDDDKVVGFCTKFELGSDNWQAIFIVLNTHRKAEVIGYVKQIVMSADPRIRAQCYMLCD